MIHLVSHLPEDRRMRGRLVAMLPDGTVAGGPWLAYGKADSRMATLRGNAARDQTKPFGDHPTGRYRVMGWVPTTNVRDDIKRFGPGRLTLDPIEGIALVSKMKGRHALLIHGGDPTAEGELMATFGCLRVSNETALILADLHLNEGISDYRCMRMDEVENENLGIPETQEKD